MTKRLLPTTTTELHELEKAIYDKAGQSKQPIILILNQKTYDKLINSFIDELRFPDRAAEKKLTPGEYDSAKNLKEKSPILYGCTFKGRISNTLIYVPE
jgi:hypothetical protein